MIGSRSNLMTLMRYDNSTVGCGAAGRLDQAMQWGSRCLSEAQWRKTSKRGARSTLSPKAPFLCPIRWLRLAVK
jgi:hypothetical protein